MRLTEWNGKKWILPQGRNSKGESNWRIISDRLAAYENTGLEPEEILLLIDELKGVYDAILNQHDPDPSA